MAKKEFCQIWLRNHQQITFATLKRFYLLSETPPSPSCSVSEHFALQKTFVTLSGWLLTGGVGGSVSFSGSAIFYKKCF